MTPRDDEVAPMKVDDFKRYVEDAFRRGFESAQGAAPRAEGLDVERLREAMTERFTDGDGGQGIRYRTAEEVAAEYARLSRPSDEARR